MSDSTTNSYLPARTNRSHDTLQRRADVENSLAPGAVDLPSLVPLMYALLFRNVASDGFTFSDPQAPGDIARDSRPPSRPPPPASTRTMSSTGCATAPSPPWNWPRPTCRQARMGRSRRSTTTFNSPTSATPTRSRPRVTPASRSPGTLARGRSRTTGRPCRRSRSWRLTTCWTPASRRSRKHSSTPTSPSCSGSTESPRPTCGRNTPATASSRAPSSCAASRRCWPHRSPGSTSRTSFSRPPRGCARPSTATGTEPSTSA